MTTDTFKDIEKLESDLYRHRVDYWQWYDNRQARADRRRRPLVKPRLVSRLPDADMQAVPKALLRAARRAREIARQTRTAVVVVRDGKLVEDYVGDDQDDDE